MKKKLLITLIIVFLGVILVGLYIINFDKPSNNEEGYIIGISVNTSIQSPHPYPNGNGTNGSQVLVWSKTLEYPGATSLRLHFKKFGIWGSVNTPIVFGKEVNYGKCDLNAPKGYERKLIDPNTIQQTAIIKQHSGEVRVGSLELIPCGIVRERKKFTPQEIFNNYKEYIKGDFVVIRKMNGEVLDILTVHSLPQGTPEGNYSYLKQNVWGHIYNTDAIKIELYADGSKNVYGLYIDKYMRGYNKEEREKANDNFTGDKTSGLIPY